MFKNLLYKADKKDNAGNPDPLTDHGKDIFNIIWGNTAGLPQSLFPNLNRTQAESEFIRMIKDLDNNFFKFINVK